MDIPITIEVTITDEDGNDPLDMILDAIAEWKPIEPSRVVVDCPYAGFREFGSGPARNPSDRDVENELFEWAKRKLGMEDAEARRMAKRIYHRILKKGLLPTPYFRPAIQDTVSDVNSMGGDWLDAGHTLHDIAEAIVMRSKDNLKRNDIDDTGELSDSIEVDIGRAPIDVSAVREGEIDERIWESDELGADGVSRPPGRWRR